MIICFLLVVCVLLLRRSRVGFCNRQHYKISSRAPGQSQIKASVPDPPQTRLSVCLETSELMNNWMPFFPTNYISRYFLYSSRQDWKNNWKCEIQTFNELAIFFKIPVIQYCYSINLKVSVLCIYLSQT